MNKKLEAKLKLSNAQRELRTYATAVNKLLPAYQVVFAFAMAEAKNIAGTLDVRKAYIVERFNAALEGLENAADTLRVYLGDAIAVACKPDITVKVQAEGAKVGEKATETLNVAGVKRYADIRKLASAARTALGGRPKTGGAKAKAAEPTSVDTVKAHVCKMLSVETGRAVLQKWAGEVGVWLDFKVQTETSLAATMLSERLTQAAEAADARTAMVEAARAAAAKAKAKKGKAKRARA